MDVKYGAWNVSAFREEEAAALEQAGYAPLCARVLSARGCATPEQAAAYLSCDTPLNSPFLMKDMKTAADRVRLAVARREHIAVFGDYDVDGITATCLLTDFLLGMGARVTSYIPARLEEGYGLNETAIEQLYRKQVNLIVTVDCGITANAEAELCKKMGIDLVITDHHECKQALPRAVAVVDPHRPDATYPHTGLSGVGVAFQLAAAISGRQAELLDRYADLLCLGLIADVMPLQGEVRTMVVRGLQALQEPKRPGLRALMAESGVLGKPATASTVGYFLAPRINAAGRMGRVELAVELFLTRDEQRAEKLAAALCRLNRERQRVEAQIYDQAVAMLPEGQPPDVIVLAGETWHQGVVGIVASRLSEEYACPAFLICMDGDRGKASSRSYGGFNLFAALTELSPLLESYGGHELAAGFTILRENIPAFAAEMRRLCINYRRSEAADSALRVDCEIDAALLTMENIQALQQLEPCGTGCPGAVYCLRDVTVEQTAEVGGGKHLRLTLRDGRRQLPAIFFSTDALRAGVAPSDVVDVAFVPQINEFRGMQSVQLCIMDIRPGERVRQERREQAALYRRYAIGARLTAQEADALLPVRSEFVAVWRYLISHSTGRRLQEEFTCLSRKVARISGLPLTMGKTRICLDVFDEQGLIRLRRYPKYLCIEITTDGSKVDLDESPIIRQLRSYKSGAAQ